MRYILVIMVMVHKSFCIDFSHKIQRLNIKQLGHSLRDFIAIIIIPFDKGLEMFDIRICLIKRRQVLQTALYEIVAGLQRHLNFGGVTARTVCPRSNFSSRSVNAKTTIIIYQGSDTASPFRRYFHFKPSAKRFRFGIILSSSYHVTYRSRAGFNYYV